MGVSKKISSLSFTKTMLLHKIQLLFHTISTIIDYLIPKDNNLVIIGSNTGEFKSGSPKELFEYITKNHVDTKVHYYLPFQEKSIINVIKYIFFHSVSFYRCKYLISSHPPNDFFPFMWSQKKILINTWHGTPIKSLFFTDKKETSNSLSRIKYLNSKTDYFITSSDIEKKIIKKCFDIDSNKIINTGHPRNDVLIQNNNLLRDRYQIKSSYIILYCPTYRRGKNTQYFPFKEFNINEFNKYLEKNDITILIRNHVYDKTEVQKITSKRLIYFGSDVCSNVYDILSQVDMLITDYSSIFIDYLLLNRPCIFVPYDLDEYLEERGLLFDYEKIIPGEIINSYKDLTDIIIRYKTGTFDDYINKRLKMRDIFHSNQNHNAAQKIYTNIIKREYKK
jgi:CDP-glycerol glycerophosphotransferase (TagB/SpsB family)